MKKIEELLVDSTGKFKSRRPSVELKKRIIQENLLPNRCSICGLQDQYNGRPLRLQLDHIDGNPFDNRIENLRILCANCHSQTETFCGRNKKSHLEKKKKKILIKLKRDNRKKILQVKQAKQAKKINCEGCGKPISPNASNCKRCAGFLKSPTKIEWKSVEELQELLKKYNYSQLGKILGVSDNAIRKRLRKRGSTLPKSIGNNRPGNQGSDP